MDSLAKPESLFAIGNIAILLAVAVYFYRQMVELEKKQKESEERVAGLVKHVDKLIVAQTDSNRAIKKFFQNSQHLNTINDRFQSQLEHQFARITHLEQLSGSVYSTSQPSNPMGSQPLSSHTGSQPLGSQSLGSQSLSHHTGSQSLGSQSMGETKRGGTLEAEHQFVYPTLAARRKTSNVEEEDFGMEDYSFEKKGDLMDFGDEEEVGYGDEDRDDIEDAINAVEALRQTKR